MGLLLALIEMCLSDILIIYVLVNSDDFLTASGASLLLTCGGSGSFATTTAGVLGVSALWPMILLRV